MSQFFDDLWSALRFQFKPIEHYFYSPLLILLVLLPYIFLEIFRAGPIMSLFVKTEYSFTYFYIIVLFEIGIYSLIFALNLFKNNHWRNVASFMSLIFFIESLALVFYITPATHILAYFIKIFSLFIMLKGLQLMSEQAMLKVMFNWFISLIVFVLMNALLMQVSLQFNIMDQDKYLNLIEEVAGDLLQKPDSLKAK